MLERALVSLNSLDFLTLPHMKFQNDDWVIKLEINQRSDLLYATNSQRYNYFR